MPETPVAKKKKVKRLKIKQICEPQSFKKKQLNTTSTPKN